MELFSKYYIFLKTNGVKGVFNFFFKKWVTYLSKKELFLEYLIQFYNVEFTLGRKNVLDNIEIPIDKEFSFEIEKNKWCVLGSGFVYLDPWIKEFNEDLLGNKIIGNTYTGNDIKNIWDIARLQYILPKWLISKQNGYDQKEGENIIGHIEKFIKETSFGSGPLYSCTMEVAIRATNICVVYNDIISSPNSKRSKSIENYLTKLFLFIIFNLEYHKDYRGNHYLSNLMGLLVLGNQLIGSSQFSNLFKSINKLALHEVDRQFYDDGGNFESSSSYHCLSLEMAMLITFYCDIHNSKTRFPHAFKLFFPQKFKENKKIFDRVQDKLQKAISLSKELFKPDQTLWKFGDNDSGYILALNHNLVKVNGRCYIDDRKKTSFKEFILTMNKKTRFKETITRKIINESSFEIDNIRFKSQKTEIIHFDEKIDFNKGKFYKNTGIYILKNERLYLGINLTKDGQNGNGGHSHLDTGSYEFWSAGYEIIDPGSPVYTGNELLRNLYRGAAAHCLPENLEKFYDRRSLFESRIKLKTNFFLTKNKITVKIFNEEFVYFREWNAKNNCLYVSDYCSENLVYKKLDLHPQISYGFIQ